MLLVIKVMKVFLMRISGFYIRIIDMSKKVFFYFFLIFNCVFHLFGLSNVLFNSESNKYSCVYKSNVREFMLFLPDGFENRGYQEKNTVSLIIMLHGLGSESEAFKNMTDFHKLACERNYAVAYVDGTVTKGQTGSSIGWHYFNDKQSKKDSDFLIELTKYLKNKYSLNDKFFVAGFSNGAFMVTKLASHYSNYFTAAVSVGGMMPKVVWDGKSSSINTGFLQINGTKDEVVPMILTETDKYNPNPAMENVIEYFVTANGLSKDIKEVFSYRNIKIENYSNKVCWLLIDDGRHSWPTEKTNGVNCNKLIVDYFDSFLNEDKTLDLFKDYIIPMEPELLEVFKEAYPDIEFKSKYIEDYDDWLISFNLNNRKHEFYWNNGSMLPESEMKNKNEYWTLLYNYNYKKPLEDPAQFSKDQIETMKRFGSDENRKSSAGTPMFFFDAIYDSNTRASVESHIKSVKFLGFNVNVHERLREPLERVQKQIYDEALKNEEVQIFLKSLNSNGGYYWRIIANTNRKSFHSLGIALDLQPKSYGWKEVYWSWAKDKNPDGWMLTPLKDRWMPPQAVIDIFEEEGFIWGGKWGIWDNMHFEYHPELINMAKRKG